MKKVFIFAAVAALFVACSSNDDVVKDDTTQQPQLEERAIGFDVYTQKATTRAGWTGSVTTNGLKGVNGSGTPLTGHDLELSEAGFGVFGYYTDNNEYEQRSVPNFMYNQQVKWDGANFSYNPVVYWPNEYGDKAISDDQDKLTFFAYAPWVKVVPSSGKIDGASSDKSLEQWGVTGITKNSAQGDPILKYIGSFDNTKSVDLCWGVADNNDGYSWGLVETGTAQDPVIKNGMPWIDLQRPADVNKRLRFTFKHATAQLRVSIDADIDVDGRGHDNEVTKNTRVWVRQVTFKGFSMKGALNLNNEEASKPKWLDINGQNELVSEEVTVYDGRKDGKEGVAGAVATNEKVLGLNPALIQDGVYEPGTGSSSVYDITKDVVVHGVDQTGATNNDSKYLRPGVTKTAVNLFKSNNENNRSRTAEMNPASDFFHVIPGTDKFEVEIVYDIETVDMNLAQSLSDGSTKGSSIENRITKTIKFGDEDKLLAGHSYTLKLHLGMNSVKFDAAVTEWVEEATQDVDLPLNTPVFAAYTSGTGEGSSSNPYAVKIPYSGSYSFAITGLHGQETMKATVGKKTETTTDAAEAETDGTLVGWSVSADNAWTNGTALQTVTISKNNPSTCDRKQKWSWKGNQSLYDTYFEFTQAAHPLFLTASATGTEITLTRHNYADPTLGVDDWTHEYGWFCKDNGEALADNGDPVTAGTNGIAVYRNGSLLTWSASPSAGNEYSFTNKGTTASTAVITTQQTLQKGDVIKVVLKTGDAPVETVTCVVP